MKTEGVFRKKTGRRGGVYLASLAVLIAVGFAACDFFGTKDMIETRAPASRGIETGVRFTIAVEGMQEQMRSSQRSVAYYGEGAARTIVPAQFASLLYYKLIFTAVKTDAGDEIDTERDGTHGSGIHEVSLVQETTAEVPLAQGKWKLDIEGYADEDCEHLAAEGSVNVFTVTPGQVKSLETEILPVTTGLEYLSVDEEGAPRPTKISYKINVTDSEVAYAGLDWANPEVISPFGFSGEPTDLTEEINEGMTSTVEWKSEVYAGYYPIRFVARLSDGRVLVKEDMVHTFGQDGAVIEWNFTPDDFHEAPAGRLVTLPDGAWNFDQSVAVVTKGTANNMLRVQIAPGSNYWYDPAETTAWWIDGVMQNAPLPQSGYRSVEDAFIDINADDYGPGAHTLNLKVQTDSGTSTWRGITLTFFVDVEEETGAPPITDDFFDSAEVTAARKITVHFTENLIGNGGEWRWSKGQDDPDGFNTTYLLTYVSGKGTNTWVFRTDADISPYDEVHINYSVDGSPNAGKAFYKYESGTSGQIGTYTHQKALSNVSVVNGALDIAANTDAFPDGNGRSGLYNDTAPTTQVKSFVQLATDGYHDGVPDGIKGLIDYVKGGQEDASYSLLFGDNRPNDRGDDAQTNWTFAAGKNCDISGGTATATTVRMKVTHPVDFQLRYTGTNGSLFTLGSGVTLMLDNIHFAATQGSSGALVTVGNGATLIVNAKSHLENSGTGGAIKVESGGTCYVYGGSVSGIEVAQGGTLVKGGGEVTNITGVAGVTTADNATTISAAE